MLLGGQISQTVQNSVQRIQLHRTPVPQAMQIQSLASIADPSSKNGMLSQDQVLRIRRLMSDAVVGYPYSAGVTQRQDVDLSVFSSIVRLTHASISSASCGSIRH